MSQAPASTPVDAKAVSPTPARADPAWDSAHVRVASPLHFSSTMRALLVLLLTASTALADPDAAKVSAYASQIQRCYVDHARADGTLSVELTIGRSGEVSLIAIKAPGLPTKVGIAVSGCIVDTLDGLAFAPRAEESTTTLPFYVERQARRYDRSSWRAGLHGASSSSARPRAAAVASTN